MPFIEPKDRVRIATVRDCALTPGERCYLEYKWIVKAWTDNPRWRTVDSLYASVKEPYMNPDAQRAKELAWQVFFQLHVMPYELKKREENGDIM